MVIPAPKYKIGQLVQEPLYRTAAHPALIVDVAHGSPDQQYHYCLLTNRDLQGDGLTGMMRMWYSEEMLEEANHDLISAEGKQ